MISSDEGGYRLAGTEFGLDLRAGLGSMDFREKMRMRNDKKISLPELSLIPNEMAPENSEPYYTLMGGVQPEFTYGV